MVAYLEKTNGNTYFHKIINFLTRSSIHYALTVSPVVSTTFVEQFWMSAKSKIINNVRCITAKVAGKPVNILEASIRSDLLFDDADGIDSLHNQAILFDDIRLMGHEGDLTDEGETSERQSEPQLTPSLPHPSADQHETQPDPSPIPSPTIPIPDSIPEGSGGNHGGQSSSDRSLSGNEDGLTLLSVYDLCVSLCKHVTDQAKEIKHLKTQIKKLKKKAKPVITHHKDWMKSESVSKKGRKPAKSEPTVHKDLSFDDLNDVDINNAMDYMETDAYMQKGVSSEDQVSTVKPDEGIDKPKVSTNKPEVSTAKPKEVEVSTDKLDEGTAEPKDGTLDESVEIKDVKDSDRPRATSTRSVLTLKPLPKIDPKDKGKKVLEEEVESDAESEGVDEAKKKEAEEEMKKLAEEEATKAALLQDFDDIQAGIEADRFLAARFQEEERETFTVEERDKFLYDTIAAQRREEDTAKVPTEQEVTEQGTKKRKSGHVKMIARKRPRPQPDDDSDDEHRKCLRIVTFDSTLDSEIMETKIFVSKFAQGLSSPDWDYLLELEDYEESLTEENDQVKSWLVQDQTVPVQKQTAFGKDKSNPLIVDSLLKTIRLSIHLVVYNEELAILEQTATGKGISNPLMAGSLPKTTKPT
ncbi:hypothetical protein Tco_1547118 [Tanacetum coccineum]